MRLATAVFALVAAATALLLQDYVHAASHGGLAHSGTLLSHIIHHEDGGIADTQDLRDWTRRLVKNARDDTRFVDYTYAQYGDAATSAALDMGGLVEYLVEEEGFAREDLGFLTQNLDYGQIETELQKIRSRQGQTDLSIEIGGEPPAPVPAPVPDPPKEAGAGTRASVSVTVLFAVLAYVV